MCVCCWWVSFESNWMWFSRQHEIKAIERCFQVRVQKWLKELEKMFYGSCESYEKVQSSIIRRCSHVIAHYVLVCIMQRPNSFVCYRGHDLYISLREFVQVQALKGEGTLADALLRNVYGDDPTQRPHAFALAKYIERSVQSLAFVACTIVSHYCSVCITVSLAQACLSVTS